MSDRNLDIGSRSGANHPAAGRWAATRAALRANAQTETVVPYAATQHVAATFAQERLWFIEQMNPGTSLHNLPVVCRLSGALSLDAMDQAVATLVDRHAVLHTRLHAAGDELTQIVCDPVPRLLSLVNLQSLTADRRRDELARLTHDVAQRPFALTGALLPRIVLAHG